jgi:hypothetical protein
MWNRCGVWGMYSGEESKFASPNHIFFITKHSLGTILCVDLRIKLKVMVLLETYGVGWTYEDTQGMYMCLIVLCLYLLRNVSPFFEACWNIVKITLFIILIICTAGLALKWVKGLFK